MAFKFTNRKGKLRLYDGTGTPYYLELPFDAGDGSFPVGRPLPEVLPVLDKGVKDANSHYITGPEESYLQGLDMSFTMLVTDLTAYGYFETWLDILNGSTAVLINSHTIVTTKGTTKNDGTNFNPAFPDSRRACNLEFLLDGPSSDTGWKLAEVYMPYPNASGSADAISLAVNGMIYGTISKITAFTSGTSVAT